MIDIPLYMFANLVVTDAVTYQKYGKGFFPLLKKSGGEFGTCEDQPLHLAGNSPRPGRIGMRMEFLTLIHHLLPR